MDLTIPEGGGAGDVPREAEEITLELLGVVIEGATVLSDAELRPLFEPLLARKTVTLADIYRLAADITARYRDQGYALARAIVPAQRISNGIVRLRVIEGHIDRLGIESEDVPEDDRLRDTVRAYLEPLLAMRPTPFGEIERRLLLINDLAGVTGRAVIRPSAGAAEAGAAELVLVLSRKRVEAKYTLDTYGSRYTGPYQMVAEGNLNTRLGLGERLTVRWLQTVPPSELRLIQGAVAVPLGTSGLTANASLSQSWSRPGFLLAPLEVHSVSAVREVSLGYPFIRSRKRNLTVQTGYRHRNVTTDVLRERFTEDRGRSLFVNGTFDFADDFGGANLIGVTLTQGLGWADATGVGSLLSSRSEASPHATKLGGSLLRQQAIADGLTAVLASDWQYGFAPQASAEELAFGGKILGRGYDSAEISGDRGIGAKVELHYRFDPDRDWLRPLDVYGFYDAGLVWNVDRTDAGTANEHRTLASAGIGAQVAMGEWFQARLEVAKPLTLSPAANAGEKPQERKAPRLMGMVTVRY